MLLVKTDTEIWRRGVDYVDRELVCRDIQDDDSVIATVKGTQPYRVSLSFTPRGISQKCDCPYFTKNGYICKHIVAVAIVWDESRGILRPDQSAVENCTAQSPRVSRSEIKRLFSDPLNADLHMVRVLPEETAFGGRGRSHSQLPDTPQISPDEQEPLTLKEIRGCFSEMKRWSRRKTFDPYFCSGEMVAAFCEVLRIIAERLPVTPPFLSAEILVACQQLNYTLMTELIDDSLGMHVLSESHLDSIYDILCNTTAAVPDSKQFESLLKRYEQLRGQY